MENSSQELFVAIGIDDHIGEVVRVFSEAQVAIELCKSFIEGERNAVEEELTPDMVNSGWLYYATYGDDGENSARVERRRLNDGEF